ncbi:hypothetical protein OUZ56_005573 [Daphnia magna]|uniref:Uncharacterized protein n=1 Tax=Daphnia magna TaxID=35525 RepID=A0ABQ9YTC9_9CRUS|nr:hypothetical protein OUZ56_005573 [Daphnia magna]
MKKVNDVGRIWRKTIISGVMIMFCPSVKPCRVPTMQLDSWIHGLDCCPNVPKISPPDIFIYLVETKSYQNHLEALGAYMGISSESQQAVRDGWSHFPKL